MVVYKFAKQDNAVFLSHHDMMRLFILSLERAGVNIKKNKDGNMRVYFTPATSIGVRSKAEFVEIDTDMDSHKLSEIIKTYLPDGLKIVSEYELSSRIGLSKKACLAKYEINLPRDEGVSKKISQILTDPEFCIETKINNKISKVKVKELLYNFNFKDNKLYIVAKIGEKNLNVFKTMCDIFKLIGIKDFDVDVFKTNLFYKSETTFNDIEVLLIRNKKLLKK